MKFKVDENLPGEIAADLGGMGHDAQTVFDEGLNGAVDANILHAVQKEGRVLLTMDKGIADIRAYPPADYAGIVLFRMQTTGRGAVLNFVRRHLPSLITTQLTGHLYIVTETGIRIR